MTIPTPAQVKVPCKATHPSGTKTVPCNRKGIHAQHLHYKSMTRWTTMRPVVGLTGDMALPLKVGVS